MRINLDREDMEMVEENRNNTNGSLVTRLKDMAVNWNNTSGSL